MKRNTKGIKANILRLCHSLYNLLFSKDVLRRLNSSQLENLLLFQDYYRAVRGLIHKFIHRVCGESEFPFLDNGVSDQSCDASPQGWSESLSMMP